MIEQIDNSHFYVIDGDTFAKMVDCIGLGKAMADSKFPHLSGQFAFCEERYRLQALSFNGKHNIPTCAKHAYEDGQKKNNRKTAEK